MYQSVIRDPGGSESVRLITSIMIVDGSILLVPADTYAFVVCNGIVSPPFGSGRYEINTGVSPFFVRFRNMMTAGDPGIICQVFYVNNRHEQVKQGGTGDIIFTEKRFSLSITARAAYTIRYVITDPKTFISKLVGMHRLSFSEEDLDPAIDSMLLPVIKSRISTALSMSEPRNLQNDLVSLGTICSGDIAHELENYGIRTVSVAVTSINIASEDIRRIQELEHKYAEGRVKTDIEEDNVKRIYGNINNRTLTEVATGTARGPASFPGNRRDMAYGMAGMMATLPLQYAVTKQVMDSMSEPMGNMFGNKTVKGSPPDLPVRGRVCDGCSHTVGSKDRYCKHCGRELR